MIIGIDLIKDAAVLNAAYDDAAGVTAEFNLNVLRVLNRELGAARRYGRGQDKKRAQAQRDAEKNGDYQSGDSDFSRLFDNGGDSDVNLNDIEIDVG